MKRSFLYLATAVLVGGALAACSSAGGGDLIGGDNDDNGSDNNGGTNPGGNTTTPPTDNPAPPPGDTSIPKAPESGPGSATAAGRLYFASDVYPKVTTACGSCHSTGAAGAPKFMGADVSASYIGMDGYGLIVPNSRFLLKGKHAADVAPALTAEQAAAVTKWLEFEAKDRAGTPAAVNTFEVLSKCIAAAPADYKAVADALDTLRTQARQGENRNNCTGCREVTCSTCHANADQGFLALRQNLTPVTTAIPALIDADIGDGTFFPYSIAKSFVGLNGAALLATSKLAAKGEAVKTGLPYSHPMYTVPAAVQTAVDTYAKALIAKFEAGQCPK